MIMRVTEDGSLDLIMWCIQEEVDRFKIGLEVESTELFNLIWEVRKRGT